jgi:hypothetical protein
MIAAARSPTVAHSDQLQPDDTPVDGWRTRLRRIDAGRRSRRAKGESHARPKGETARSRATEAAEAAEVAEAAEAAEASNSARRSAARAAMRSEGIITPHPRR